jgi:hypothetical protein
MMPLIDKYEVLVVEDPDRLVHWRDAASKT